MKKHKILHFDNLKQKMIFEKLWLLVVECIQMKKIKPLDAEELFGSKK